MEPNKPCPFNAPRCKCFDCDGNANYEDCNHGYCIGCFECIDAGKAVHDIYVCTGYKQRNPN